MSYLESVSLDAPRGGACLAALNAQFPGAILEEERQTFEQTTITVKLNLLPDIVHYLYYQHDGWLPVLFGNDERTLNGHYAVYYALSMEGALMASALSMPTTVCSTFTGGWKNWQKPAWVITK